MYTLEECFMLAVNREMSKKLKATDFDIFITKSGTMVIRIDLFGFEIKIRDVVYQIMNGLTAEQLSEEAVKKYRKHVLKCIFG